MQAVGRIGGDTALQTTAIAFFGLFEIVLGYLITRAPFAPRWLGVALAFAGLNAFAAVFAAVPTTLRYGIVRVGGLGKLVLLVWLIKRGAEVATIDATPTARVP